MLDQATTRPIPERRSGNFDRRVIKTSREALESLIRLIEFEIPNMQASVLVLEENGTTLRHGAAPNLPEEYCRSIDGSQIGPAAGSCGTAAWRGEQVIVADIATDPLWADYHHLALPFGLRACWSTPIIDAAGAVLGTFAMYHKEPRIPDERELGLTQTASLLACNIIVRSRAEEALRISEGRMREARAEAEKANRAKATFLAMMSHELRTPLNAIGGYATLMLEGIPTAVTEAQENYLRRIITGQQHLLSLIDAVLTHAKIEAGHMTYKMEHVRMSELLDVVDSLCTPQLAAKEIAYDCSGCDSHLVLHADVEKATQILLNLMSNAAKFTPPGGHIEIGTAIVEPGRALIAVRDTGIGMSAEQAEMVFEPYVQFDNDLSRTNKGTGLGMPISRDLARGMGGDLTVQSVPGQGSEFVLTLEIA